MVLVAIFYLRFRWEGLVVPGRGRLGLDVLRNLWVWIHEQLLSHGPVDNLNVQLELLRFRRMLDWIRHEIVAAYHDGSPLCVNIAE